MQVRFVPVNDLQMDLGWDPAINHGNAINQVGVGLNRFICENL